MKKLWFLLFGFMAAPCFAASGTGGVGGVAINFVESNGTPVPQRNILNFRGSDINCVDNPSFRRIDCTISTGTGGGGTPGGPANSVQFNYSGTLLGTGTFTMNPDTNLLTIAADTLFSNVSTTSWTNVSTMTFGAGTDLQLQYLATAGNCLQTDSNFNVVSSTQGPCGSGSGGGGGSGSTIYPATSTPTFPFGVNASSYTSTGSGAGSITLKDSSGVNFVALKASSTLTLDQTYILPNSTGTPGSKALSRGDTNTDGSINTFWGTASDPNAAILTATETFSATQNFTQSVNISNVSSTTFTNISSMVFTNSDLMILAGSTLSVNSGLSLNGSFGTAGQVPTSNGPGAALTWGAGGGGGGGGAGTGTITAGTTGQMTYYSVTGTTVAGTSNLVNNTSSITITAMEVTSTATFNSVSSVTITNAGLVVTGGLISGTTIQTLRLQRNANSNDRLDLASNSLKLYTNGSLNTQMQIAAFFGGNFADNVVSGKTVGSVSPAGGDTEDLFDALTTPASQSSFPHAAYEAAVNTDGLGSNTIYFGNESVPGRDTYFFVAGGTNASCGALCSYPKIATTTFVIDGTYGSSSYGFVGLGVSTPTVRLAVAGFINTSTSTAYPVPVLSSCGTSPSLSAGATDTSGKITVGGGVVTSCTLTFGTAKGKAPACTILSDSAITDATGATTTTTFIIGGGATFSGDTIMYNCLGNE